MNKLRYPLLSAGFLILCLVAHVWVTCILVKCLRWTTYLRGYPPPINGVNLIDQYGIWSAVIVSVAFSLFVLIALAKAPRLVHGMVLGMVGAILAIWMLMTWVFAIQCIPSWTESRGTPAAERALGVSTGFKTNDNTNPLGLGTLSAPAE